MKKILVCGAGGFIGNHLVTRLRGQGHWVRGVDIKLPEFNMSAADEFLLLDLRHLSSCLEAVNVVSGLDEIYQLAADIGGMGYIQNAESRIMTNNILINTNMIQAAVLFNVPRYFFSSSVCIYRNMQPGEPALTEEEAYPAMPDNEYGWEKLFAERMILAYSRKYSIQTRIGRFENCYGPLCDYSSSRAKAPAALCRKVAQASDGGAIQVWGDGKALRHFVYIDDLLDGIQAVMQSDITEPTNIGGEDYISVDDLARMIIEISGKRLRIEHVEGIVGVAARNFSKARLYSLGWRPRVSLREGLEKTYRWVEEQIRKT